MVGEGGTSVELSCRVVVQMRIDLESFCEGVNRSKAMGLVESSEEGEGGAVWKRGCQGDAMVAGGRRYETFYIFASQALFLK